MSVELQGSTALVTGATGGIGQAIVRALHARGATVIASGRQRAVLEDLAREVDRVEPLVADLSDPAQVAALVFGRRIDVLVANAALPASGRLDSFSSEEIDRALDVNLRAPGSDGACPGARDDRARLRGTSSSSPRCRGSSRAQEPPSTTRPSSACAGSGSR